MSAVMAVLERLVLERLPDGRFVRRGTLPAWCRRLGRPALRAPIPVVIGELFPCLDPFMEAAEVVWRGEAGARVSSGFWTDTDTDGAELHLEALAVRVDGAEVLVVAHDERLFREQQRLLQRARELRLAHDALLREMEHKDVLLHTIVHELAAPLHTILGMLSLLDEAPRHASGVQAIDSALAAAREQKQVIGEVLEAFSAEHAPPAVALADAPDLRLVLDRVVRERQAVAAERNIRLELAPGAPLHHVVAEHDRLVRVLSNLVDNALCRSPTGGTVRLTVRREGAWAYVVIDDQGPPVPLERLSRLFGTLALRRDAAVAYGGLGLFFCRIAVERWGGGIGYEPSEHGGARFWVRLQGKDGDHDDRS
ncbi:HAMP domain-containing histidine kinase [Paraliomyxa miuraensis]|nr:HAMP domain-containing histidine kinase [Paraliomyxa miuraensis]